jgi:TIR domain
MLQSAASIGFQERSIPVAHDVFISYSSKDKTIADAVCARLEVRGIRCWIAPRDVRPGFAYGEEIIDAIHGSRVMVLVLSSHANESTHIPKEIERAVSRGIPIIPLRVEDVTPAKSLDYFISSVHWLDAITPPLEEHLESLANTIRTILPEQPRVVPPVLETAPVPHHAPAVVKSPGNSTRPKWLFPLIAAAVVVLAVVAWFVWGRSNQSETAGPSGFPAPMTAHHVQPGGPDSAQPPSSADPIVGCWRWFNNVQVVIRSSGTMTAGPFTARWRLTNPRRRVYQFTWPEAVDTVQVSADGRTFTGGNQYGFSTSATRMSFGPEIEGLWRLYNGAVITVLPDGRFTVGNISGRWRMLSPTSYALTWPDPVDTVTLTPDDQQLSGRNQYGIQVSGTKLGDCGAN